MLLLLRYTAIELAVNLNIKQFNKFQFLINPIEQKYSKTRILEIEIGY